MSSDTVTKEGIEASDERCNSEDKEQSAPIDYFDNSVDRSDISDEDGKPDSEQYSPRGKITKATSSGVTQRKERNATEKQQEDKDHTNGGGNDGAKDGASTSNEANKNKQTAGSSKK